MVGVKRRSRIILQVRMRGIYPRNPVDHHRHQGRYLGLLSDRDQPAMYLL